LTSPHFQNGTGTKSLFSSECDRDDEDFSCQWERIITARGGAGAPGSPLVDSRHRRVARGTPDLRTLTGCKTRRHDLTTLFHGLKRCFAGPKSRLPAFVGSE
jgi:hypothetical protein